MENRMIASPLASAIGTQLISTPHPVTLEGQRNIFAAMLPGETLDAFLRRNVEGFDRGDWLVSIGGVEIPRSIWKHVKPKEGQKIELVGRVGKTALFMIAIIALTIWTGGMAGAAMAGTGAFAGMGAMATFGCLVGIAAIQIVGTLLINKMLGPKAQSDKSASGAAQDAQYSLSNVNNQTKPYQGVPILFGTFMLAPDMLSKPYSWYSGNEQYLAVNLSWGIGVDHYDTMYLGTTPIATYLNDIQTWNRGFSGIADDVIPLFGNVDTQDGGALQDESGHLMTVSRTSSLNTVRIDWDFTYQAYDVDGKGRIIGNGDGVVIQYRLVGTTPWITWTTLAAHGSATKVYRSTVIATLPEGQYETQVYRLGTQSTGANAVCNISLATLTSIQLDSSTYTGIARTAMQMKATAQLNGAPDQINAVAHSTSIPVWKGVGTGWVTEESSNPGAQMLKYLRGYYDSTGKLIAGCGYSDDEIDIAAYQAFMLFCTAGNYTYDYWMSQDRSHLQMLEALAQAGFGEYTDAMGLHSVIWSAQDQPIDGIINMSRVQKGTFNVTYTLVGTSDGIAATYVDKTKQPWADVTIYVPSPTSGTTTITNPANVTLEGVTNEAHAAKLTRFLMAQQAYQYKGIDYGTSFEWLTYRRFSMVQMQHDLTQWGYGGNVIGAVLDESNKLHLTLDVVVPPPATGNAYIGLRIPGEASYRVFTVVAFGAPTDQIVLVESWPVDADVPGDADDNPVFDTLWIYDFKQTPGLACRVISVQPQAGFKGATISLVPESDEFWTYVNTGTYHPPNSGALLPSRPTAANLTLTEQQIVTGDVASVTLSASFAISGVVGSVLVYCDLDTQGQMQLVSTLGQERSATWSVVANRPYTVTVRPFTPEGFAGTPTTASYTPVLPNQPPHNVDVFNITDLGDGLRNFAWGFSPAVQQSPNMAGVEIRYVAGNVPAPDWSAMTDMGATSTPGYFTSAFTSNVPAPGGAVYTFAIRVVNTDGILSTGMLVKIVSLSESLAGVLADSAAAVATLNADVATLNTDVANLLATTFPRFAGDASNFAGDNAVYVGQWSEASHREDADNVMISTVSLIGAATADRRSFILDSTTLQVTPGQSLVQTIRSQQSQLGDNVAAINTEATTRATADSALSTSITSLTSTVNANTANISTESTTRANADSALSTNISSVSAQTNTNTANISTVTTAQATTAGYVAAQQTLTLDVNGYISGTVSQNNGTVSSFTVLASKFTIVDPAGGAHTEYSLGNWRVYDASSTLRVRLGVW